MITANLDRRKGLQYVEWGERVVKRERKREEIRKSPGEISWRGEQGGVHYKHMNIKQHCRFPGPMST